MVNHKIIAKNLNLWYGNSPCLKNINISIPENAVTAIMGPSGCGKSTLLRVFNRLNDLIDGTRITGEVLLDEQDIYKDMKDVFSLRKKVGMVFQKVNPFPKTIFENVVYGLKIHGWKDKAKIEKQVQKSIIDVGLWDEVKDCLHKNAFSLSGGQQQRLCIARAIAIEPEVVLFDEPCSSLDPISTAKIEQLMEELKEKYTIIIVTHNLQQAARVSDYTAFMLLGELIEFSETNQMFTTPKDKRTENYLTGKFG
ncbi:phosphate ABC transporter ATP-binding protein [candidate division WOR-3 bacterium]|nr:phosphate ABC transporter ATP-binding protein [candidate division WOR-3 bacterium]